MRSKRLLLLSYTLDDTHAWREISIGVRLWLTRGVKGLENHIIVLMLSKHVDRLGTVLLASFFLLLLFALFQDLGIGCSLISLFLVGNLLQSVELLSVKLIELGVDV